MARVEALSHYETVSRDPATLGQPVVAVTYTIDGKGPFEVRIPKGPGWETKVEAAIRADSQVRAKVLKIAFDL